MRRNTWMPRLLTIALVAAVLVLGTTAVALADDIYVNAFLGDDLLGDGSVASPFASIGAAMTTATAGDDIYVAAGAYYAAVDLKTGVDIWGAGPSSTYVVTDADHAFEASGTTDVTIDGLNFFGSFAASGSALWSNGSTLTVSDCAIASNISSETGAFVVATSTVTIEDCLFEDNEADHGAALASIDSSITLTRCTFRDNTSWEDGGAIWSRADTRTADATYVDCVFERNVAGGSGGAIDYDTDEYVIPWGALVTFDGCTFTDNEATDDWGYDDSDGGAIDFDYLEVVITDSTFTGSSAAQDGGAIYSDDCSITVDASTFRYNAAGSDGGAVSFSDSWGTVSACTVASNTAGEEGGGLDFYDDDIAFDIVGSTITSNTAKYAGGGIHVDFDNEDDLWVNITGNVVAGNRTTHERPGDSMHPEYREEYFNGGGGILVRMRHNSDDCTATISDNIVVGNSAEGDGGGIAVAPSRDDDDSQEIEYFAAFITGNTVTDNYSDDDGGGIYTSVRESYDTTLVVSGNTIERNSVDDDGGGFFFRAGWDSGGTSLTIEANTLTDNTSVEDGGGAFLSMGETGVSSVLTSGNVFARNVSGGNGGGMSIDLDISEEVRLQVLASIFTSNTADNDGGGWELEMYDCVDATVDVVDSYFAGNYSDDDGGGVSIEYVDAEYDDIVFRRCTIIENVARDTGGGVDFYIDSEAYECDTEFISCTVSDNQAGEYGGGFAFYNDGSQEDEWIGIRNSTIERNYTAEDGGGVFLENVEYIDIFQSTIASNEASQNGGGVVYFDSDECGIWDSVIRDNTAAQMGGGVYSAGNNDPLLHSNEIVSNEASEGGGVAAYKDDMALYANLLADNEAGRGGGFYQDMGRSRVRNNVFDSNAATGTGGGIWMDVDSMYLTPSQIINNTFVSNWTDTFTGDGVFATTDTPRAANNIFWDMVDHLEGMETSYSLTWEFGIGNFFDVPMFRDPGNGDFRLQSGSPCIDSGVETVAVGVTAPSWDYDDETRPQDGVGHPWYEMTPGPYWDIGAFEMPDAAAPVSMDDTYTVAEDTQLTVDQPGVLANDYDINGDTMASIMGSGPSNGSGYVLLSGAVFYEPDPDWYGTDHITYAVSDGTSLSAMATVTIVVTPVNDVPDSIEDSATCAEDGTATVSVLDNDSDTEMSSLTATLSAMPASGTVVMDASGNATYTPNADFNGTDMFWYRAFDGTDHGAPTTVTITVTPVNDAPVAVDDAYTTSEDTTLTVRLPGPPDDLIANDWDTDGDAVGWLWVTSPGNGTLIPIGPFADGTFDYVPGPDFFGTDTFTYALFELSATPPLASNTATVTITVTPVNDAPRSSEDATGCAEDTFATINVLANDSDVETDPMTAALVTPPSNGSVSLDPSGDATYTPDADWFGTDHFWYQASDGTTQGAVTTVTITVTPVNDAPVADEDAYTTAEDTTLTVTLPGPPPVLLDNDTDVEGHDLDVVEFGNPANGTITGMDIHGQFTYTPNQDWYGTDVFSYRARESTASGLLYSNWTTVTITVTPVNDAPVSVEDTYTVEEDGLLIVPAPGVIQNDYDVEDDPLTGMLTADAANGTLVFAETGAIVYSPDADFYGTDVFWYSVYDGELWSVDSSVTITVTPVQDAPISEDDTATCAEDGQAVFNVLANDTDADPLDVLTSQVWGPADHGTVEMSPSGDVTYTPDADWFGNDTFVYRTFDGTEYSALALVSITVTPVNDPPVALDDHYETTESTTLTVPAPGVLGNDFDIEFDSLAASLTIPPGSGVVTATQDGGFDFLPDDGFWGTDTFVYVTSDGATTSAPATVTIDVFDVTPPVTVSDATWDYYGWACVSFTATDTASGVATTWYSLDGATAVASDTVCTDVLGQHTLSFWSVDNAGNIEDPTTVEFELEAALTDYETIAGSNRYATASAASLRSYPGTVTTVILATGENWPDALGGAALAGVTDAPILLTRTDALPGETIVEITRLGATEAYILGGFGAVSTDVRSELIGLGLTVTRLSGSDRYGTSRAIAHEVVKLQGPDYDGQVFLSTGMNFADAMAAGPAAAEMGWPIYLTRPDAIDDTTLQHMVDHDVDKVAMLGGPNALSGAVETRLDTTFGDADVKRLAGSNRYKTAIDVAEWTVKKTPLIWDGVAFATGLVFPDALAAGPMQAELGSVLLLTSATDLPGDMEAFLIGKREIIDEVRFMGGDAAIAPSVKARIAEALR